MARPSRTTTDILRSAEETLATAEHGLQDLVGGTRERKLPGLRNLAVFGRAVTNVLQNLRSTEPEFEQWYKPYQDEMRSDPLLRYFYDLRSEILKEGALDISAAVHIRRLSLPGDLRRFGSPPPNAKSFFIGDNIGGTGWEVQLADGSLEKYYVELPSDMGWVTLHFPNAPKSHLGRELKDGSVEALSRLYLNYLRQLVSSARKRFGTNRGP